MVKHTVGFATDYTNLAERFRFLLDKSSDTKPFRLFALAWQEVGFYRMLWGRSVLVTKVEFYHELFDSLIDRLRSDVEDINNMFIHVQRDFLNPQIRAGLISMATVLFTTWGIYANIPAKHKLINSNEDIRLSIRIRITYELFKNLTDLLKSLLERSIVHCKLAINHKMRLLIEQTMTVFVRLKNSQALSISIFEQQHVLGEEPAWKNEPGQGEFSLTFRVLTFTSRRAATKGNVRLEFTSNFTTANQSKRRRLLKYIQVRSIYQYMLKIFVKDCTRSAWQIYKTFMS